MDRGGAGRARDVGHGVVGLAVTRREAGVGVAQGPRGLERK